MFFNIVFEVFMVGGNIYKILDIYINYSDVIIRGYIINIVFNGNDWWV